MWLIDFKCKPSPQGPTTAEIDAIVAALYGLLAASANTLGACVPSSDLGTGWIQSSTEATVLSALLGVGLTQPATPGCTSLWGAAVVEQVRGMEAPGIMAVFHVRCNSNIK